MKKYLTLVCLLMASILGYSQVKVENTVPYFDVQFKRAMVKGNSLIIDLSFVNTSRYDTYILVSPGAIIDDEGTRYKTWYTEDNRSNKYELTIPAEITQRLRFVIKELDEYATSFQVIDFECYVSNQRDPDWHGGARGKVRLRNVPFTRENN